MEELLLEWCELEPERICMLGENDPPPGPPEFWVKIGDELALAGSDEGPLIRELVEQAANDRGWTVKSLHRPGSPSKTWIWSKDFLPSDYEGSDDNKASAALKAYLSALRDHRKTGKLP